MSQGASRTSPDDLTIGVLALQGDVREHSELLAGLGVRVLSVRNPESLDAVDAIVLPGGESTTLNLLLASSGLDEALRQRLATGLPALGTCAGMIVLAADVLDGRADQRSLGAIDIAVRRNAFGRQTESFETDLDIVGMDLPMHAVFIRAPVVERVGDSVRVLATTPLPDGSTRPVVCRSAAITVASFHPELAGETRLHKQLVVEARRFRTDAEAR